MTSACLVDRLVEWWETVKERFAHITTLLINLDNGPESHSRRTEVSSTVRWSLPSALTSPNAWRIIRPTRAASNAIERCWGILDQHCNGALLDSVDAVLKSARTMTWKGKHPVVELVTTTYQTRVKLTKAAMKIVESQLERLPHLDKWFVDVKRPSPASWDSS